MAWFIGQSLLVIALAFGLGLLVGWLWWGRSRPVVDTEAAATTEVAAAATTEVAVADEDAVDTEEVVAVPHLVPAVAAEPAAGPGPAGLEPAGPEPEDDLQRIEGIGPKMSAALRDAGIRTYARLAATDVAELRSAIRAAGLTFAPSIVTWARQARLLADGDEAGFADLTRRLVAGRDTGVS